MSLSSLKVCVLNCENLFLLNDLALREENKPHSECATLAQNIKQMNPDILLLTEIGGRESLQNFNSQYLGQVFDEHIIKGNSDRNIEVAALTRKTLPFQFQYKTNKNLPLDFHYRHELRQKANGQKVPVHCFSRDAAELWVYDNEELQMILINCHLKSQRDPQQIDPKGSERREAELKKLLELQKQRASEQSCPVFVAGDFNGNASRKDTSREFLSLYQETNLEDALEITQSQPRSTYFMYLRDRVSQGIQLDYFFAPNSSEHSWNVRAAEVFKYSDTQSQPLPHPPSAADRSAYPSDHMPLLVVLGKTE